MEFEHCEIRSQHHPSGIYTYYEFIAEAIGPHGSYIVTRTPEFPAEEHMVLKGYIPFHFPSYGNEPDDNVYQRKIFNILVDHLVRTGWEPLAESGPKWYNRRFRRRVSRSVPDMASATPYTLGDLVDWRQKLLMALDEYKRHPGPRSCRKLAEAYMQFGLGLEREHQFKDACAAYFQAGQKFEEISLTHEAAQAYLSAERVLNR